MDTRQGKYSTTIISELAKSQLRALKPTHAEAMRALFHKLGDVEFPLEHNTMEPIRVTNGDAYRQKFPAKCEIRAYRNIIIAVEGNQLVLVAVLKKDANTYHEKRLRGIIKESGYDPES